MQNNEPLNQLSAGLSETNPVESPPALWNPNAAGCWSLIFTPLFGAYLHMKNWEILAEPELAKKSRTWVIGCLVFLIALFITSTVVPDSKGLDAFFNFFGFFLTVSWYYAIGKSQQTYVLARFGKGYIRRAWTKPLMAALLVFLIFFLVIFLVAFVSGR